MRLQEQDLRQSQNDYSMNHQIYKRIYTIFSLLRLRKNSVMHIYAA